MTTKWPDRWGQNMGSWRSEGLVSIAREVFRLRLPRFGSRLNLNFGPMPFGGQGDFVFATGAFEALVDLAEGRTAVAWTNPSAAVAMARRGVGPFDEPLPLMGIAVAPSWDLLVFAVHEDTGITALPDFQKMQPKLRISTRQAQTVHTLFGVNQVLGVMGLGLQDFVDWGGQLLEVSAPPAPERRAAVEQHAADAVFDEGIKTWGPPAAANGFRFLPVDGPPMEHMEQHLGFRRGLARPSDFPGLKEEVETVDFSGWPIVVREDMPEEVAYALVQAIDMARGDIRTDNYRPLDMAQVCRDTEETPWLFPMHPGAERYYREHGYL